MDVDSCLANLDRLSALTATGLMDAPAREDLDGLARRAAAQLGTPMAFMSLVDNPLRQNGFCLGSFCVVDVERREWTDDDLAKLQKLADQAMKQISP